LLRWIPNWGGWACRIGIPELAQASSLRLDSVSILFDSWAFPSELPAEIITN
jgi:hypothetical protein